MPDGLRPNRRDSLPGILTLYDYLTQSHTAVIVATPQGRIAQVTAGITNILGWKPDDLIGKPVTILVPDRYRERHEAAFRSAAETGATTLSGRPMRLCARNKDGGETSIELTLGTYHEDDSDLRLFAIMRDIRDYVALEEETQRMQDRIAFAEAMTNSLTMAIIVVDHDGVVKFANKEARRIYAAEEMGKSHEEYLANLQLFRLNGVPYQPEELPIRRALHGEEVTGERYVVKRPDGREIVVETDARPVESNGRRLGAVLIVKQVVVEYQEPR